MLVVEYGHHRFPPPALLQQVMQLTPQQIEALPPQQKQQVLALQQQMVRVWVPCVETPLTVLLVSQRAQGGAW